MAALERIIGELKHAAEANPRSADAQYELALANSYASEVALEMRDKKKAERFAETGIEAAKKAVTENEANAEYHRLLGELCGQVIPASPFLGSIKYGQCARDEIDKAIQLNNRLALAYVSRGVGELYLPPAMGGGLDLAIKEFNKAISIDPNLPEAYLWKGIALRRQNRNPEARKALARAVELDPNRLWAKQQLEKTPAS